MHIHTDNSHIETQVRLKNKIIGHFYEALKNTQSRWKMPNRHEL